MGIRLPGSTRGGPPGLHFLVAEDSATRPGGPESYPVRERDSRTGGIVSIPVALMTIFLPVTMIAVFAFTSVASWAEARRKEREAFYRSETLKKIAESSGAGGPAALEMLREEDRNAQRNRRDAQRLGAFVCIGVAIGLMVFLRAVEGTTPVYLIGLIPLFVGVALFVHVATSRARA